LKIDVRFDASVRGITAAWVRRVVNQALAAGAARRRILATGAAPYLGVLVTTNAEIRKINRKFLSHDYATDVISFGNDGRGDPPGRPYLGDLVVSADMARAVSEELNIKYKEELARYLVHGSLHLLGYLDKSKKDRARMFRKQEAILTRIFSNA